MNDSLNTFFGNAFMDTLLAYPSEASNIRYYHRLKARVVQRFIEHTGKIDRFLDAGAGRGPYSMIAAVHSTEVFCDEYNPAELVVAEKYAATHNFTNIIFKNSNLIHTEYPDTFFDTIVCSEVLEHIPERERAVQELTRILKPGGKILISMPQKNSLFYQRVFHAHPRLRNITSLPVDDPDWETFQHLLFSAGDIKRLITSAGLVPIGVHGANIIPVPTRILMLFEHVPFLCRLYYHAELLLSRIFPQYCSFYFIEATKKQ